MKKETLRFHIDINVLNHLGIGLYSSTPAVVTEIISNAWDADASLVTISINPDADIIRVEDNGHGMEHDDVQDKFLCVGFSRRKYEANGNLSQSGKRRVMGRKGIGKLAMFSLAKQIQVVTRAEGKDAVAFEIDVGELRRQIEVSATNPNARQAPVVETEQLQAAVTEIANLEAPSSERMDLVVAATVMTESVGADDLKAEAVVDDGRRSADYPVKQIPVPSDFVAKKGTRITLTGLNSKINKTASYLKPRLARRFGVFSEFFKVRLNEEEITRKDAGFYDDIQFLWHFDDPSRDAVTSLAKNIATYPNPDLAAETLSCVASINGLIQYEPSSLVLRGFVATVDKPAKLGKKGDESINRLSIFANGRLFQEDILAELGDARYFNSYLIGEIHADFLDQDDVDRATASREAIRHDDAEFQALRNHLRVVLDTIRDQWDTWRGAQGYENDPDKNPVIEDWINSFPDKRDKKSANRLMVSISKLKLVNDEAKEAEAKRMLYRSAVVGFEKLRARSQLDALESITDVLSPEFQAIFASLDDIEESYYLDIVRSRLEVIRKFDEEIVDAAKQEKVAQKYLFKHLWLLDPSWDRVMGSEQMEVTLTNELKRACPDANTGARLDIAYCTTAGRHVIIELKRPGLYVIAAKLEEQGRKYVNAVEQWYREHPDAVKYNGRIPPIDVYFLVDCAPDLNERDSKSWDAYNLKALTYKGMIANARMSYQGYLSVRKDLGRVAAVLEKI